MTIKYCRNIEMMEMNMMGMCMCCCQLKQVINLTESVDNSYEFSREAECTHEREMNVSKAGRQRPAFLFTIIRRN